MNIIFAGTPEFAAQALQTLLTTEHNIIAVYTQPDRPAGRGRKLQASPVKTLAVEKNIPVYQPLNFKTEEAQQELIDLNADIMVVVAYGLILPKVILDAPKKGCINIHASLLPRWRGAAPIQRAILAGDKHSGVTIMQMNEGLDTGNMILTLTCDIENNDTGSSLHDKLALLGAEALLKTLELIANNNQQLSVQDNSQANYAHKLDKKEAQINWQTEDAINIVHKIQAFNSWPVAFTQHKDKSLRLWQACLLETDPIATNIPVDNNYGQVIAESAEGIDVQAKNGTVRLLELQMPGKKRMMVKDFIHGQSLLNSRFE